jgi:nucleotide-binding universal stress UspA family protein
MREHEREPSPAVGDVSAARTPGTIVATLDRSKLAESALVVARNLAECTGYRVLLTSVVPVPAELSLWSHTDEVAHEWLTRRTEAQHYLDEIAGEFEDIEVDTAIRSGSPVADEILAIAKGIESALIVMASHGRSGIKRMMVGSVTAQVVRSTLCPVVVVRAHEGRRSPAPGSPVDRLLVALDGSPFAEEALSAARAVFGASGLTLHLLRVVETPVRTMGAYDVLDESSLAAYSALETYLESARDDAASYLDRISSSLAGEDNRVTWQVAEGRASAEIIQSAEQRDTGLIVMSTHGRTGLGRMVLGSVADQVLHASRLPLMLVRPRSGGPLS